MMFSYPKALTYQYIIDCDVGYIILRYKQATAEETIEYFELLQKHDIIRISEYREKIVETAEYITTRKRKLYRKRQMRIYLKKNIFQYHNEVIETMHKTRKSRYEDEYIPRQKGERKNLFPSTESVIYEQTGIPADQIYKRLTLEQIGRRKDKVLFDYLETYDDGKAVNTNVKSKAGLSQEQKDLLAYIKENKNV